VTGRVDGAALAITWLHVGLRIVHAAVHLSCNYVMHRLIAFATSNAVLSVLWLRFLLAL